MEHQGSANRWQIEVFVMSEPNDVDRIAEILEIQRVVKPTRRQDDNLVGRPEQRSKVDVQRSRCSRGEHDVSGQAIFLLKARANQPARDVDLICGCAFNMLPTFSSADCFASCSVDATL